MASMVTNFDDFQIAIAQMPITGNAVKNGAVVRKLMYQAAESGARLIQFPEGALSGYAKNPIRSWEEVDWGDVQSELESVMRLAEELNLWVILGSAHPLTYPKWPHNSLYVISSEGKLVNRYDKRICSNTEKTRFYTGGYKAITFEVDGIKFGCLICIEINFPTFFMEYQDLGIDCLLLSAYPVDKIFYTKTRALAAIYCFWIGLSVPSECMNIMRSSLIGPDGNCSGYVKSNIGITSLRIDKLDPVYVESLNYARPWRTRAIKEFETSKPRLDTRSRIRTLT